MTDGRLPDLKILQRAIAGESSAFGLLYDEYQPAIYRFIYLKVSNREEAEDLTHHVFLSAWQHIGTFEEQGIPFSSWLYRIARNRVIDYYRTNKHTQELDAFPEEVFADLSHDTHESLHKKDLLQRVHTSLTKLPQDQHDIILFRYVQELSYDEIARIMKKNPATVRVLQHRAVAKLKKILS